MATMTRAWSWANDCIEESCLRVGSVDPFQDPMILFALFQLIEMLIRTINFFKFEK